MGNKQSRELKERVERAADAVLKAIGSVGPLELLLQMRLLAPSHFIRWQKESVDSDCSISAQKPRSFYPEPYSIALGCSTGCIHIY